MRRSAASTEAPFIANNVTATERVLDAARRPRRRATSSISARRCVNSAAHDCYTETKKAQETLVVESGIPAVVLRPTLMFGWFDRKHLGWLARFMARTPVFPVPGHGRYLRQPLYAGDFCDIIMACIERRVTGQAYNISGQEQIDYIDLIRAVTERARRAARRSCAFPTASSGRCYGSTPCSTAIRPSPPSSSRRWSRPDVFEVIDWPAIFGVKPTPLAEALARDLPASRLFADRAGVLIMARVASIGAGAMGLAAAYHALKAAIEVTVFEAEPSAGGMAAHFDFGGLSIERYYHFVCKADQPTFELMAELGIGDKMRWRADLDGLLHRRQALSAGAIRFRCSPSRSSI